MKVLSETPNADGTFLCWECTGSGWMAGRVPCKICSGTGRISKELQESFEASVRFARGPWKVETTIPLDGFRLKNITKFTDMGQAISFSVRFNGKLSALNP